MDIFNSYGFFQHVDSATRGDNILHLVISTSSKTVHEIKGLPAIGSSNHGVILFSTAVRDARSGMTSGETQQIRPNWRQADYQSTCNELFNVKWDAVLQYCFSVQDCWNAFIEIVNTSCFNHEPLIISPRRTSVKRNRKFRFVSFCLMV